MTDEEDVTLPEKMLVLEIALDGIDAEEFAQKMSEDPLPEGMSVREALGFVTPEVVVTVRTHDEDRCPHCGNVHEHLEAFTGEIVRARVSDTDWVVATADEPF